MKRFDLGRLFALLCLVLPLLAAADTVKIGDGETGRPLNTTDGVPTRPGTLLPCEIENINRCAVVFNDSCVRYTADAASIKTEPGVLTRVIVETQAATGDDFVLYDNTAASGTVLLSLTNMPATSTVGPITMEYGGAFTTGLSLDVTFTAGSSIVVCQL